MLEWTSRISTITPAHTSPTTSQAPRTFNTTISSNIDRNRKHRLVSRSQLISPPPASTRPSPIALPHRSRHIDSRWTRVETYLSTIQRHAHAWLAIAREHEVFTALLEQGKHLSSETPQVHSRAKKEHVQLTFQTTKSAPEYSSAITFTARCVCGAIVASDHKTTSY